MGESVLESGNGKWKGPGPSDLKGGGRDLGNPRWSHAVEVAGEQGPVSELVGTSVLSLTKRSRKSVLRSGHLAFLLSCTPAVPLMLGQVPLSLLLTLLVHEGLSEVHGKHPGPQAVAECHLDI